MARLKTDWILFLTILAMVAFGLVMVYSASSAIAEIRNGVAPYYFAVRQLGWAGLVFRLMYFKRMDYRRLNTPAWAFRDWESCWATGDGVFLRNPAPLVPFRRLGSFQPSEFAKPALIIFLAYFLDRRARVINDRRTPSKLRGRGDAGVPGGGGRPRHRAGSGDHCRRGFLVAGLRRNTCCARDWSPWRCALSP
jgi:cell division protein FtsW